MPYNRFTMVAYRGGAGERPENTLAAFGHALAVDRSLVLDLDVRLTRDGVPVVMHDELLSRTTNGTGPLAAASAAELSELDAGYCFAGAAGVCPFRDRGLRVPTLEEVFERFPNARFNVDLRANDPRYVERTIAVIERCGAHDRVIVVSEHDTMVALARRQRPGWCYGAPMGEVRRIVVAARLRLAWLARTRADIFMIPETHEGRQVLDDRLLDVLHWRGKKVWIWVVNQPADVARLRQLGVDGIFTEHPQRILQAAASA